MNRPKSFACLGPLVEVFVLLCLAQTHTTAYAQPLASTLPLNQRSPVTIPFDRGNNLVIIEATINDRGPFRFVLDTGSSHHFLSRALAETLGLKLETKTKVDVGSSAMIDASQTEVSKLEIGELAIPDQHFFIVELPKPYPFQGILGVELFKQFIITIDFAHSLVTMDLPDKHPYSGSGTQIRMKLRDGFIPELRADVDGHSGWFKIDTGYNASLALFAEFVARHPSLANDDSGPPTYEPGGQTIAGEVGKTRIVRIKELKFEAKSGRGVSQQNVPAALFTEKGGSNSAYAGAIGTLVLQRYIVTLDYRKRLIRLEAN